MMITPDTTPRARLAAAEAENVRLSRENAMLKAQAEALREEVRVLRLANRGWARKAGGE